MNTMDTKAAVGMLTAGPYGIAHMLSISCENESDLDSNWDMLRLCDHWRLRAAYGPGWATLTLQGSGEPVPVTPPIRGHRFCIVPEYIAEWTMDDPAAVRFFMAGCKRHGYFALLPAIRMQVDETRRPIVAFLRRGN